MSQKKFMKSILAEILIPNKENLSEMQNTIRRLPSESKSIILNYNKPGLYLSEYLTPYVTALTRADLFIDCEETSVMKFYKTLCENCMIEKEAIYQILSNHIWKKDEIIELFNLIWTVLKRERIDLHDANKMVETFANQYDDKLLTKAFGKFIAKVISDESSKYSYYYAFFLIPQVSKRQSEKILITESDYKSVLNRNTDRIFTLRKKLNMLNMFMHAYDFQN